MSKENKETEGSSLSFVPLQLHRFYGKVTCVDMCWVPNDSTKFRIASGSHDGRLLIRDISYKSMTSDIINSNVSEGIYCISLQDKSTWILALQLNRKEDIVASGGLDCRISIHKFKKGQNETIDTVWKELPQIERYIQTIQFLPDDGTHRILAGSGDSNVYIFNYQTLQRLCVIQCGSSINDVALSFDGRFCFIASLVDMSIGELLHINSSIDNNNNNDNNSETAYWKLQKRIASSNGFERIKLSPNEQYIATGASSINQCYLYRWYASTSELELLYTHQRIVVFSSTNSKRKNEENTLTDIVWLDHCHCMISWGYGNILQIEIRVYNEHFETREILLEIIPLLSLNQLHSQSDLTKELCTTILLFCGLDIFTNEFSHPHTEQVSCLATCIHPDQSFQVVASGGWDNCVYLYFPKATKINTKSSCLFL